MYCYINTQRMNTFSASCYNINKYNRGANKAIHKKIRLLCTLKPFTKKETKR